MEKRANYTDIYNNKSISSYTKKKTINLGSLNWSKSTQGSYTIYVAILSKAVMAQCYCSLYTYGGSTRSAIAGANMQIGITKEAYNLCVRNDSFSDASSFKTAMSGVMLTYESTEYTEIDNLLINVENSFPNGMCSVGEVRDILDLANGIATKKIGVVDLGTLSWDTSTIGRFISQSLRDIAKLPSDNSIKANIILSKYSTTFYNNMNSATGADNVISLTSGGNFYVRDTSLEGKTANEFKSLVNGLLLYYELATPTETTISKAKAYYKVSANGKEIAVSEGLSAPLVADIAYRGMSAEDLINELNG